MKTEVYAGIYRGVVESVDDPLKLGRCRIRVPSIHGSLSESQIELLPWARYISPLPTGKDKGTYIIPEVKDVVWVMFEGGSKRYPVYLGSTYGIVNGEAETPLDENDDKESTEVLYQSKLTNGKRATIKKTSESFIISFGDSSVEINLSGDININSSGNINLSATGNIIIPGITDK